MPAKIVVLYYNYDEIPHERGCLVHFYRACDCNCIKVQLRLIANRLHGRVPAPRVPPEIRPGV